MHKDLNSPGINVRKFSQNGKSGEGSVSNSDEKSDSSSSSDDSKQNENELVAKKGKITNKIIKRVNTQRFLDLGVPGGYERFNYEDAIRQGMLQMQL